VDPIKIAAGIIAILGTGAVLAKLTSKDDEGKEGDSDAAPTKSAPLPIFKRPLRIIRPRVPNANQPPGPGPVGIQPAPFRRIRIV